MISRFKRSYKGNAIHDFMMSKYLPKRVMEDGGWRIEEPVIQAFAYHENNEYHRPHNVSDLEGINIMRVITFICCLISRSTDSYNPLPFKVLYGWRINISNSE